MDDIVYTDIIRLTGQVSLILFKAESINIKQINVCYELQYRRKVVYLKRQ